MGNDFFSAKDYASAEEMYTSAIESNKNLPESYLNRANARLQLSSFDGALADYALFLQLAPQDPAAPQHRKGHGASPPGAGRQGEGAPPSSPSSRPS